MLASMEQAVPSVMISSLRGSTCRQCSREMLSIGWVAAGSTQRRPSVGRKPGGVSGPAAGAAALLRGCWKADTHGPQLKWAQVFLACLCSLTRMNTLGRNRPPSPALFPVAWASLWPCLVNTDSMPSHQVGPSAPTPLASTLVSGLHTPHLVHSATWSCFQNVPRAASF